MEPITITDPTLALLIGELRSVPFLGPVLVYVPPLVLLANVIDAFVPVPPEGSIWVKPRQVVHFVALNFRYARNAVPAGAIPATVAAKVEETKAAAAELEHAAGEAADAVQGNPQAVAPTIPVTFIGERRP